MGLKEKLIELMLTDENKEKELEEQYEKVRSELIKKREEIAGKILHFVNRMPKDDIAKTLASFIYNHYYYRYVKDTSVASDCFEIAENVEREVREYVHKKLASLVKEIDDLYDLSDTLSYRRYRSDTYDPSLLRSAIKEIIETSFDKPVKRKNTYPANISLISAINTLDMSMSAGYYAGKNNIAMIPKEMFNPEKEPVLLTKLNEGVFERIIKEIARIGIKVVIIGDNEYATSQLHQVLFLTDGYAKALLKLGSAIVIEKEYAYFIIKAESF